MYTIDKDGTCYWDSGKIDTYDKEDINKLVIAEGIAVIPAKIFSKLKNLIEVELPQSLREIGYDGFSYCTKLQKIDLKNVIALGINAFANSGLTAIDLSNVAYLAPGCFRDCDKLRELGIINCDIPDHCFEGDHSLEYVKCTSNVQSIGDSAFSDCYALVEIGPLAGLKAISDFAFWRCFNLQSFIAHEALLSVGHCAFGGGECNTIKFRFNSKTHLDNFPFGTFVSEILRLKDPDAKIRIEGLNQEEKANLIKDYEKQLEKDEFPFIFTRYIPEHPPIFED